MSDVKATVIHNPINETAYAGFVDGFSKAKTVTKAQAKVKKDRDGMYVTLMQQAALFTSHEEAVATLDLLTENIAMNKGGLANKVGAALRKEVTEGGKTHKVPDVVSNVKSVILWAFETGTSLYKKDGKTLDTFSAIRTAKAHAQKEPDAPKIDASKLTGLELARFTAFEGLNRIAGMLPQFDATQVSSVQAWIDGILAPAQAEQPKPKARARRAPKADVAADLAKAA